MANQFQNFLSILKSLEKQNVEYILIGGVAVILHGFERLTRDIDIIVKMTSENIEKLCKALASIFEDPSIDEITLEDLKKYPVLRYGTPDDFYIDIMARIGEIASYENLEYEIIDYQNIKIKIVTPEKLYKLKKHSVRQRDQMDAFFLQNLIEERESNNSN